MNANTNADPAELGRFAALAAEWWDTAGPLRTLHALNPLRVAYIAERAALDAATVLDVGCGGGILCEALAREKSRVTGIDLADQSLEIARAHAAEQGLQIAYRSVSVEELAATEPGHFDVVTCMEVLEHVPDPAAIIAACARAARPGGSLFFSTINRTPKSFALAIVAAEYVLGLVPRGTHQYLKLLKPSELAASARSARLEVADVTGLHYNPLTDRYWLGGNADVNYFVHATKARATTQIAAPETTRP